MFENLMNLWLVMLFQALDKVDIDKKNFKFTYELMAFVLKDYESNLVKRTQRFRKFTGTSERIMGAIQILQEEGVDTSFIEIQKPIGLKEALDLVKVLDCATNIHSPEAVLKYLEKMDKIH